MTLPTGSRAPEFTLKRKTAEGFDDISLAQLLEGGKHAVILFFPLAFTSVCKQELCSVSSGLACYEDLNASVAGISVDSPFTLEVFARQNDLKIPILSDFNKEASRAYQVLDEEFLPGKLGFFGVAKRAAFVVAPDQTIKYAWVSDDPDAIPPFDELQAALRG